jgi:predicted RNase H-like nuclease
MEVFEATTYSEAAALSLELRGLGISRQMYALRNKLLEVNRLRPMPHLIEVHPEVSFRAMTGADLAPKSTWNGLMARRRLLERAGIRIPSRLPAVSLSRPDDVLDAAAAAWSAQRFAQGIAGRLPAEPEAGHDGRDIAIWY